MADLWKRLKAWHAKTFPCTTEYWIPGSRHPVMVDCDAYYRAHERAIQEIQAYRELCRERVTRPEYV